jgi:ATP-binding cassette subfamily B protein/subfamily B ATP-binding cassette protein MsbA
MSELEATAEADYQIGTWDDPFSDDEEEESGEQKLTWVPWGRKGRVSVWVYFRDLPQVLPYLRPYWKLEVGSIVLMGLTSVLSLLGPWPLAIIIDSVVATGSSQKPLPGPVAWLGGYGRYWLLALVVVGGLLVTALQHAISVWNEYLTTKLEQSMALDFQSDLLAHAQKLSLGYHSRTSTGGLMYRMNSAAPSVGEITVAITPLLESVLTLGGMFTIAFLVDRELALISLTVVPFIYYSAGYYAGKIRPRLSFAQALEMNTMSLIHEAMSMIRVVVAFGREDHHHQLFRESGEASVKQRVRVTVHQTVFSLAVNMLTALGTALVLGIGALHVIDGRLQPGELLVMLGYIAAIYSPLETISTSLSLLQSDFIVFRAALGLLGIKPKIADTPDSVDLAALGIATKGEVEFREVSYAYETGTEAVKEVSFHVEPGQRVAVVGPTGAGKTTLMSLLLRFMDPDEGEVLLDGADIRSLKVASLRDQISVVLQEPMLFQRSIRENIRYGRLDATDEEVEAAAKAANAHDFILDLPDGYDSDTGEGGAALSGGERQRICVARAFLRDAPILILDEPTSSIDSRTEAVILSALDLLSHGRTTFMIAHRLSTVRNADLILVIDEGRLVESGTHEELLEQEGLYQELYAIQSRHHQGPFGETAAEDDDEDDEDDGWDEEEDPERAQERRDDMATAATLALVGAVLASVRDHSKEPLEALSRQRLDPDSDLQLAGRLAAALLSDIALGREPIDLEDGTLDSGELVDLAQYAAERLANDLAAAPREGVAAAEEAE